MLKKQNIIILFIAILITIIAILLIFRREVQPERFTRSVTGLRLNQLNPIDKMKLTGMVEAWKEENLSFEVPGRIEWVIDKGREVFGGENSYSLTQGDGMLIAQLGSEEYKLKLKIAQANKKNAVAGLNALDINIKEVMSQQLEAVNADFDNATKEFNRIKSLFAQNAASQRVFDSSETALKKAAAKFSESKATITVKKAEIEALKANLEQLNLAVKNAELDLKRTQLRVPYQGKIAQVYANIGANVKAGEKVLSIIVVDPISVKLNISPNLDRKFHYGQFVKVYSPFSNVPVSAMVNRKAAIADPNTHTFSLDLLLRNKFITAEKNIPAKLLKLPRIHSAFPVVKINRGEKTPLAVLSECIQHDKQGDYLWKIIKCPDALSGAPVFTATKARAELSQTEYSLLGAYKYRIILKSKELASKDLLAIGISNNIKSGSKAILIRKQRMFRPGDLVRVDLFSKASKPGLYVPSDIVCSDSLKKWVFKVTRQENSSSLARQIFVKTSGRFNDQVMIISPELKPGDILVNDGAQFLIPNEVITVKSISEEAL